MIISIHVLNFGVVGIAISHSVSNFILMLLMWWASAKQTKIKIAIEVDRNDPEIPHQVGLYLSYGLPNLFIIMIDMVCFQSMAIVAGFFGIQ